MAAIAEITFPYDTIECDHNGVAEQKVNIHSVASHRLRVGLRVLPDSSAHPSWFNLEAPAERDLEQNETLQWSVNIKVPEDAPAGRHTFRVEVFDVSEPGEHFSKSDAVALEVPAPPPKVAAPPIEKKKAISWLKVIGIFSVIIITVLAVIFFLRIFFAPSQYSYVKMLALSVIAVPTVFLYRKKKEVLWLRIVAICNMIIVGYFAILLLLIVLDI